MKHHVIAACIVLALSIPAINAGAAPAGASVGIDLAPTTSGALMGAAALGVSLSLPVSRAVSLDLEPSAYGSWGTGVSVVQVNLAALGRLYLAGLSAHAAERATQRGLFLAAGAVAAWERLQGTSTLSVVAGGPTVRAGYRIGFGSHRVYLEPSFGFTALFGGIVGAGGPGATGSTGISAGLVLGYRL